MLTLIIANGSLHQSDKLTSLLQQADLIIAADGGANHCPQLGIRPDILLGDLDSIEPQLLAEYQKEHSGQRVKIVRHPRKKDATDLELGLDLAMSKGADSIYLVAALGGRWDMSLANIMLAASVKYQKMDISLLDKGCSMQILHPGKKHNPGSFIGQQISFLPLGGDVYGVNLSGFEYPLNNHTITFGSTLGISNVIANATPKVQLKEGVLLCVISD